MVSYIKGTPFQSRLLAKICEEMRAKFKNVLLHTEVRWLSRERVLGRIYELRKMMLQLFRKNMNIEFCDRIQYKLWCTKLVWVADISEHLNKLNTGTQEKRKNVFYVSR